MSLVSLCYILTPFVGVFTFINSPLCTMSPWLSIIAPFRWMSSSGGMVDCRVKDLSRVAMVTSPVSIRWTVAS